MHKFTMTIICISVMYSRKSTGLTLSRKKSGSGSDKNRKKKLNHQISRHG